MTVQPDSLGEQRLDEARNTDQRTCALFWWGGSRLLEWLTGRTGASAPVSLKSIRSLFPRDVLLQVPRGAQRGQRFGSSCPWQSRGDPAGARCATHPPSPVWERGRTGACPGTGRVGRHPPAQELQKQGAALAGVVAGSFSLPSSSRAGTPVMGTASLCLLPPHRRSPPAQKHSRGPLLPSRCGDRPGTFLPETSSSSGGERRALPREGSSWLGSPMLGFALSKTSLPAAHRDGGTAAQGNANRRMKYGDVQKRP